jgi:predicted NUDIX family NTP pyrophosphohydrolase
VPGPGGALSYNGGVPRSAGILLYRDGAGGVEILLVHPGGPFWAKKDAGAWSIPKGEHEAGEDALAAALREFAEETGSAPAPGELTDLGTVRQKSGKVVRAWALAGDIDADAIRSNTFALEWPPRSGRRAEFPEVDRAAWFGLAEARERINPAQAAFLDRLRELIGG